MPILWQGVDHFGSKRDYDEWMALVLSEQRQMVRARVIAAFAAFDDLPPEEQRVYVMHALAALKQENVS